MFYHLVFEDVNIFLLDICKIKNKKIWMLSNNDECSMKILSYKFTLNDVPNLGNSKLQVYIKWCT